MRNGNRADALVPLSSSGPNREPFSKVAGIVAQCICKTYPSVPTRGSHGGGTRPLGWSKPLHMGTLAAGEWPICTHSGAAHKELAAIVYVPVCGTSGPYLQALCVAFACCSICFSPTLPVFTIFLFLSSDPL